MPPVIATRRFVLGTALAGAAAANAGTLLQRRPADPYASGELSGNGKRGVYTTVGHRVRVADFDATGR